MEINANGVILYVCIVYYWFWQGLRFDKNQSEEDMDKMRQKYSKL